MGIKHSNSHFKATFFQPLLFFGLAGTIVALISNLLTYFANSLYCNYKAGQPLFQGLPFSNDSLPITVLLYSTFATFASLLFFWILIRGQNNGFIKKHCFPFYEPNGKSFIYLVTSVAAALASVILVVTYFLPRKSNIFENVGSLFAVATGIFTIVGVFLTLQSVRDFKMIITSFSQLVSHICDLIDETGPDDFVRFMAWTPALGFLALPEHEWNKLYAKLYNKGRKRIQITCLDIPDLEIWHNLFIGRQTERPERLSREVVEEATKTAEDLLKSFAKDSEKDSDIEPSRKRFGQLPGYYLFANRHRAIMVAPFFIQLPLGTPEAVQKESLPPVQMMGFEISEPGIVKMVHNVIDLYRKQVPDEAPFFEAAACAGNDLVKAVVEAVNKFPSRNPGLSTSQHVYYRISVFEDYFSEIYLNSKEMSTKV